MTKVLAIDLDGTLLNRNKSVSSEDRIAIQRAQDKGVLILIATSRNRQSTFAIAEEVGVEAPVICLNGALICSKPYGDVIEKKVIPVDAQRQLMAYADAMELSLSAAVETVTYKKRREPSAATSGAVFIETFEEYPREEETLRFLVTDPDSIPYFHSFYKEKFESTLSMEMYCRSDGSLASLGFYNKEAAKYPAIQTAITHLGINDYSLYAIGDNFNDLSMLQRADVSGAPANSVADVLNAVHYRVADNNNSGVAEFINLYVLEQP